MCTSLLQARLNPQPATRDPRPATRYPHGDAILPTTTSLGSSIHLPGTATLLSSTERAEASLLFALPFGPTPPPSSLDGLYLLSPSLTHQPLHSCCTLPSPASIVVCLNDAHEPDLCTCYQPLSLFPPSSSPPSPSALAAQQPRVCTPVPDLPGLYVCPVSTATSSPSVEALQLGCVIPTWYILLPNRESHPRLSWLASSS